MTIPVEQVQNLMSSLEQRERQRRRRAILYALLPVVLAAVLVGFTSIQIQKLGSVQTELKTSQQALQGANTQLVQTRQDVVESQQALTAVNTNLAQTQGDYQGAIRQLEATHKELEQASTSLKEANAALKEAETGLKEAQLRIDELQKRVDSLTKELQDLSEQFAQANAFKRYAIEITPEQTKDLAGTLPEAQSSLVFDLLNLRFQGIRFNPTGSTQDTGFNSPNFAVYMLRQHKLLPEGYDLDKKPWEQLPTTERPENGDLVYYRSGYVLFYYNTPFEFVAGMTPVGILTLRPDFAPILGYLKVRYP